MLLDKRTLLVNSSSTSARSPSERKSASAPSKSRRSSPILQFQKRAIALLVFVSISIFAIYFQAMPFRNNSSSRWFSSDSSRAWQQSKILQNITFESPKSVSQKISHPKLVNALSEYFIVVNLGRSASLAESILSSWGSVQDTNVSVGFVACSEYEGTHRSIIQDDEYPCEEYPPILSWMVTLKILSRLKNTKWFLKCDHDSYVNIRELESFFNKLEGYGVSHEDPYYFGSAGYGREKERHLIGLNNGPFVMGGPCVGFSVGALKKVLPILDECMHDPVTNMHSDTQLGRCFQKLNISVHLPFYTESTLRSLFKQMYKVNSVHDGSTITPFDSSTVPPILPDFDTPPITLHSIKDPALMLKVHAQLHFGAIPLDFGSSPADFSGLRCAHNPSLVRALTTCDRNLSAPRFLDPADPDPAARPVVSDRCSVAVPECAPPATGAAGSRVELAVVVCRQDPAACLEGPLARRLREMRFRVEAVAAPPPADSRSDTPAGVVTAPPRVEAAAAAEGLRRALQRAQGEPGDGESVLVVEEGAALHRNFSGLLGAALGERRCGCGVSRGGGCVPGVLLLGFGSRSAAASREYDAEARRRPSACVNLFPDAAAAAAAVYSRDVLPLALAWLEAQPAAPPDRLHAQLAAEGFAVRGVRPPIAIPGLSPAAAADLAVRHRGRSAKGEELLREWRWSLADFS